MNAALVALVASYRSQGLFVVEGGSFTPLPLYALLETWSLPVLWPQDRVYNKAGLRCVPSTCSDGKGDRWDEQCMIDILVRGNRSLMVVSLSTC